MSDTRATIGSERGRHRFFVVTSGVLVAIVLVGFSPSFFLKVLFQDPGMIVRVAPSTNGAVRGQDPPGGSETPGFSLAPG